MLWQLQYYRKRVKKVLGYGGHGSGGTGTSSEGMFRATVPAFQDWLNTLFAPHNAQVRQLLQDHAQDLPFVMNVEEAKWSLPAEDTGII